ncbi:MAG: RHS repeat protein [Saprospiraceae bacterium]|nr:RHS repeat protein [Saprospiraceae bacterium]
MGYNGLDISRIAIGSGCGFMMLNNYEYDGLHRITAMKNIFFGQQPYPDAFSTTYSYDPAGNIQTLTRRGIIDMGAGNAPQSDFIDDLRFPLAQSLPPQKNKKTNRW